MLFRNEIGSCVFTKAPTEVIPKPYRGTSRQGRLYDEWGDPLSRPKDLETRINNRWEELGLSELEQKEPKPELFGYVIDQLIEVQNSLIRK